MPSKRQFREWTDPELLQKEIDKYFDFCSTKTKENFENGIKLVEAPNWSGLALWLKISRQTLTNYRKKPEYRNIHAVMEIAVCRMVSWAVSMGFSGSKFSEFFLANFDKENFQSTQKIQFEKDTESVGLLDKYKEMPDEDFQKELSKEFPRLVEVQTTEKQE